MTLICPWCVALTGEEWAELQRVQLSLLHTAALEELWCESPAGQSRETHVVPRWEGSKKKKETGKKNKRGAQTPEEDVRQQVMSPVLQTRLLHADVDVALSGLIAQQLLVSGNNQEVRVLLQLLIWWEVDCSKEVNNQLKKSIISIILRFSTCLWLFKGIIMNVYVMDTDVATTFFGVCRFFLGFGIRRRIQFQDQRFHLWLHCHETCAQRHLEGKKSFSPCGD